METSEAIKRRIESTEDMQSVVKTMKTLAAVSIRQYERAVEALADYSRAVELGLQVALQKVTAAAVAGQEVPPGKGTAIVTGSDLGMCGRLNEQIAEFAVTDITNRNMDPSELTMLAIGERVVGRLEEEGFRIQEAIPVPGSVSGIAPLVEDLLVKLEELRSENRLGTVLVFHNKHKGRGSFSPITKRLLPADREWLEGIRRREWPGPTLPMHTMQTGELLAVLMRQYLFIGLYRAIAESLASESSARLVAMQGAERNIEDRLEELTAHYHQQRQMAITGELLDIVAGFEALREDTA
jgi:F-type H+-transporting ATPase subunit gamma